MARDAGEFWRALERRLPGAGEARARQIARSVLVLLRFRIKPEGVYQLGNDLPEELGGLWTIPFATRSDHQRRPQSIDLSHNKFLERVQQLARLADVGQAAWATVAVFGAMREVISPTDAEQIEDQLPLGLKELWRVEAAAAGGAPTPRGGGNGSRSEPLSVTRFRCETAGATPFNGAHANAHGGASPFWASLDDCLEGQVAATAGEVTDIVVSQLRARLSPELADRVRNALSPDLRSYWAGIGPTLEREEPPGHFIGGIARRLGLSAELPAARHAAASTMGALRQTLPPHLADAVAAELPSELRPLWDGERPVDGPEPAITPPPHSRPSARACERREQCLVSGRIPAIIRDGLEGAEDSVATDSVTQN